MRLFNHTRTSDREGHRERDTTMTEHTIQHPDFDPAAVLAAALHLTRVGLYDVEGIGSHLSCMETAALGSLYVAAGYDGSAENLLHDHVGEDHPDESCSDYSEEHVADADEVLATALTIYPAPQATDETDEYDPGAHESMPDVTVETIDGVEVSVYRAACSCGWRSMYAFTVEADAADAQDAHRDGDPDALPTADNTALCVTCFEARNGFEPDMDPQTVTWAPGVCPTCSTDGILFALVTS